MSYSPQDVYARHLVSPRGYPLWTPEPDIHLPEVYIQEGLKIGDVGVVVPRDGSFDVFFNVCLPSTDPLHREYGVPPNFTPIPLTRRDIAKFPEAESAGRIISTSSVARVRNTDASGGEDQERHAQPGPLNYEFTLSSREGAVLILPEGAERYYLRNENLFLDEAIQHAVDWYTFVKQRLGRIISHDALYLITGFYKARSWSLAAYQHGAGAGEASAHFKAVQVGRGNIRASYFWESTHAVDWRAGPSDQYYCGIANQAVFIEGFKIAVREGILGMKRVRVKIDSPVARSHRMAFSSASWFSKLWSRMARGSNGSMNNAPEGTGTGLNTDAIGDNNVCEDVTIRRFPLVSDSKLFHPSDFINQYLLREAPSATIAVTHDSQWITLLKEGLLSPGELSQEDRLVAGVINNYHVVSRHGTVHLKGKMTGSVGIYDDNAVATSISSEECPRLSPILLDEPTPQLSNPGPPATDDPSAKLYACGYGDIPSINPESSHAMYRTAHELQEHVQLAHPDVLETPLAVFRCGFPRCGQLWKHIEELEHHIQLSDAHSQNAIPAGSTGLPVLDSDSHQVLPTIVPARNTSFGASALEEHLIGQSRNIPTHLCPSSSDQSLTRGKMSDPLPSTLQFPSRPPSPEDVRKVLFPAFVNDLPLEELMPMSVRERKGTTVDSVQRDCTRPTCARDAKLSVPYTRVKGGPGPVSSPHKRTPAFWKSPPPPRDIPRRPRYRRLTSPTTSCEPPLIACSRCKAQMIRCNGGHPNCTNCVRRSIRCAYDLDTKGSGKKAFQPTPPSHRYSGRLIVHFEHSSGHTKWNTGKHLRS